MHRLRQKTADLLDSDNPALASRLVDIFIIMTIAVTVISIILESEPALHPEFTPVFVGIEFFSLTVFVTEYLLRVWSAPSDKHRENLALTKARLDYIFSLPALIDLIAILPFILSFFSVDLRFLRILRLLRIFKLTRYNSTMNTMMMVIQREARAFLSIFFIILILLIISSSCIYLIEHKAQPEAFGSILSSMWWSIVTLATVGYGDVAPITPLGKLFGGITIIFGIGLVALPAGLLASAFSEQLHRGKSDYRSAVKRALADGVISPQEHKILRTLQEKYDIPDEEAHELIKEQLSAVTQGKAEKTQQHSCPHCGEKFTD